MDRVVCRATIHGAAKSQQDLATKRQKGGVGSPCVPAMPQEPLRWEPSEPRDAETTGESISLSVVPRLFATPRAITHQAPLSLEFSRQEFWDGLLLFSH